jgi:phosphoserine phosphatase
MPHCLTLVASDRPLDPHWVDTVYKTFQAGLPVWLRPNYAVRATLKTPLTAAQMGDLRGLAAPHRVDVFCTATPTKPYRLMLADMDATMIIGETLNDLATRAGMGPRIAQLTAAAMDGSMDYRAATIERLALLRGTPRAILEAVRNTIAYAAGGATLIATLRAQGVKTILVSGGFTYFVGPVADTLGFDHYYGNTLDLDATGGISGNIREPLVHHARKLEILREQQAEMNLDPSQIMAIGDGANDVPMLMAAGLGLGYRPKPVVAEKVDNLILYGDLTALLYAGGYRFDQFVVTPDPLSPTHDPSTRAQIQSQ